MANVDLKNANAVLNKEKAKLTREVKLLQEQMEREKTLVEAECRTKVITAQSNYERKLDEERAKNEEDKKSIYHFIANEFHEFYKPVDRINDATFRNVVRDVHDTLVSMSRSDASIRSMLQAVEGQTTEDAVAQYLIH